MVHIILMLCNLRKCGLEVLGACFMLLEHLSIPSLVISVTRIILLISLSTQ